MRNKGQVYLVFILILILASFLRLWRLDAESLRLDEAQSVWQASHSMEFILDYMVKNVHLPLHNTLLHFWMQQFGTSEQSVRLLSAIPGILTVAAFYFLAKEMLGTSKNALIGVFIAAISPFWIWYSREIRMYTLLTLVTTLSYLFYIKILKTSSVKHVTFYTLVNLVGIYTHYFFFMVLGIQALFFILAVWKGWTKALRQSANKMFYQFLFSAAFLYLAFLPWLAYFYKQHGSGTFAPELAKPSSFNLFLSLFEFAFGYQPETITSILIALWPLLTLLGFIFLAKRRDPMSPYIYLALFGTLFPLFSIFFFSITVRSIYMTRYLIPTTPLFLILITWFLSRFSGAFKYVAVGSYFVLAFYAINNQHESTEIPSKENYRAAVEYVSGEVNPRDIVVLSPPYTLYPFQYYYTGNARLSTMPIWDKRKGGIPLVSDVELKDDSTILQNGHKRIFLITTLDLPGAFAVKEYMDYHYRKLDKVQFSKYLWVNVYQAEYPPEELAASDETIAQAP